ncbi:GAF domain-containing hybrid sensor histidine kinase/response regulator [Candidatus Magnetominusculus xianensis]|uniref:histidine kinase n=1 Tax=Candidatus Magnetominusculus xianensis TaxID=1748249 RepID=A0ABR5SF96_9BACT|nr:GAF domain-containing hybrid sensor histidine kinase/response regulator [Candidatus Magnetominusculus xianensis]KWT85887.1 multi-sensor signal transduction histidine kinase [Candidatus Magnetominusculus xianensis]MBF0403560.1 response regulator [Nitrospirota bacterium]
MIQPFGGRRGSEFFIMDFLQKFPAQALDTSVAEEALCEDIRNFTNSEFCAIVLHDENGIISKLTLTPQGSHEFLTDDLLEKMIYVSVGSSSIKMWDIPDKKELFSEVGISPDIFNILSMPLFTGPSRIGTLLIVNITIDANTISLDPLFQTMDMIGKIIGLVLKNAYFYQETQEQLKLSKFMAEIGIILASSASSLIGLLQNSAEAIVSHLGVSVARIWVVDETGHILELLASAGLYTHVGGDQSRITVCKDTMGIIARESLPRITNSAQTDPLINGIDWVKRDGIIAFAGYPLLSEGRVTGVLAIFSKNILTKFTIDSIATVSYSIAIAVKNQQVEKMRVQAKKEAETAKEEADRVKKVAETAKEEADRVKKVAETAKEEADRVKKVAEIAKEEADRVKKEAEIAKEVADRAKAEAVVAKEVAARAMEEVVIAKEEAERANRSKSDFLSNMSHEIRTPMNAIIGLTDIVLERILDEKQKEYLLIVKSSANFLLSTINGILDIMKIESGKFELENMDFSIKAVVASAIDMFLITAPKKGILIKYDISPEVPSVLKGDPTRLRQVLINLIGNALKFTLKGEINVALNVLDGQNQKDTVNLLFSVKDTGIGIAPDRKETIFKRFTQADSSTTREYGGTGLGLTINKEFVNLMGGAMWVESELGVGSTFYFTVVMKKTDKEYVLSTEEFYDQHRHILLARPRRKFRILVVEDIEENILLLNIRLQQYGHTVIIARNGLEAVERFKSDRVDVILMDVQMPVMDGLEATRQIRKLESSIGGRITIIALTASVMREEKASYIRKGVDAVVEKPIEIENLLSTIELTVGDDIGEVTTNLLVENEAASLCELASIDGIDVSKGITVWKDAEAYKKALMGFSRKYGDAADKILFLIEDNDIDGAHRIAHSLDGVSGNLSIVYVFKVARELSHSLKDGKLDNARTQLGQLKELLRTVVDSINKIHVQEPIINHKRELDSSALKGLILRLVESCEADEPDEAELILIELHGVISAEQEEAIKKYIEDLDFDGAKEETLKLAISFGIVPES